MYDHYRGPVEPGPRTRNTTRRPRSPVVALRLGAAAIIGALAFLALGPLGPPALAAGFLIGFIFGATA